MPISDVLQGLRVVSTAINIPGPVAASRLTALGARVVKVEPPSGDPLAHIAPGWYAALCEGQEIVALDLKKEAERTTFDAMLAHADLLLTASRPAALSRLGLGWEALHARHPRLCHVGIIGLPHPNENESGHDLTYQARAGLLRPPAMPTTLIADLSGAERAVSESIALLYHRERTGNTQQAWVSLSETAERFAAPRRYGLVLHDNVLGGGLPGYRIYRASDGYVAVAALEAHFLVRLEAMAGASPADHDALESMFRTRSAAQWEAWGLEADVPIAAAREYDRDVGHV